MKKVFEDIKKVFESQAAFRLLSGIGVVIVTLLIFSAGVNVGFHRASFGQAWGEHYMQNFGMMPARGSNGLGGVYFPNAHGAAGKIIKIELPNIIVAEKDNTEKAVLLSANTKLQKTGVEIQTTDLKIDDFVVIIGTPNSGGIIEAKFIRVIPNPELLK